MNNLEIVRSVSPRMEFTQIQTPTNVATNHSNVKFVISAQIPKVIASLFSDMEKNMKANLNKTFH